ncbi:hypothetical protein AB2N04_02770 [Nitratireductor sp. GISD-1A_MAKvit]|uniref:hypothetical protein n=1 Tax=Nitratireductor sp. GISD-1A_MAKvit TaxID=3234198 RepID=UPI003466274D
MTISDFLLIAFGSAFIGPVIGMIIGVLAIGLLRERAKKFRLKKGWSIAVMGYSIGIATSYIPFMALAHNKGEANTPELAIFSLILGLVVLLGLFARGTPSLDPLDTE